MTGLLRQLLPASLVFLSACPFQRTTCMPAQPCDSCLNGTFECTFEDITITSPSCQACSTRIEVYDALCASGRDLPLKAVEPSLSCVRVGDAPPLDESD